MRFKSITLALAALIVILLLTTSCSRYRAHPGPVIITNESGPPAHAPAHGYRRKHVHGVELVFDSGLGLYVVVGRTDHYYHDGYFFRFRSGIWERCPEPDGHWKVTSHNSLPIGLQAKAKVNNNNNSGKENGKGKGRGNRKKGEISVGKMF